MRPSRRTHGIRSSRCSTPARRDRPARSTRAISGSARSWSNQWKACATDHHVDGAVAGGHLLGAAPVDAHVGQARSGGPPASPRRGRWRDVVAQARPAGRSACRCPRRARGRPWRPHRRATRPPRPGSPDDPGRMPRRRARGSARGRRWRVSGSSSLIPLTVSGVRSCARSRGASRPGTRRDPSPRRVCRGPHLRSAGRCRARRRACPCRGPR